MPQVEAPRTLAAFPSETRDGLWVLPFGLVWDRAVLDPEVLNYDLQVDTVQTFSSPNARILTKTSANLSDFQEGEGVGKAFVVDLPKRSLAAVTWYWRMRINDGITVSPWTAVRSFTVPANNVRSQTQELFDKLADANSYAKEANSSNVYKMLLQVGRELDLFLLEKDRAVSDLFLDGARDTALINNFSRYLKLDRSGQDVAAHHRWKTYHLWKAFVNYPGTAQGLLDTVTAFLAEPPTITDLTTTEGWVLPFHFIEVPSNPEVQPIITLYSRPSLGNAFVLTIFNSWDRTYDREVLEYYIYRMRPAHSEITINYSTERRWSLRYNLQVDWSEWTNSGTLDISTNPGTVRINAGQTSGTLTSPVERVVGVSGFDSPIITAEASGQTVTVEYRTSSDGVSFSSWVTLQHGVEPDSSIPIHDYVQFRLTLSRTAAGAPNPILSAFEFRGVRE